MTGYTLPYRTDWQDMESVLDYAKGSGAERTALDARFGAGESMRETLNTLEQLALALRDDSGGIRLTVLGDRLAYAPTQAERLDVLVEAMLGYPPYRMPLERALAGDMQMIDGPWVEHVWQVDMRLRQPRNRVEEARTFFFRLADVAGLGSYRRGVRGQSTRLELASDFAVRVRPLLERPVEAVAEADRAEETLEGVRIDVTPQAARAMSLPAATQPASATGISITVDMTDWDLERIEVFLNLIGFPIIK
jgi:acyl-coenzyme A thioesterase PaaI-like protein